MEKLSKDMHLHISSSKDGAGEEGTKEEGDKKQ